MAYYGDLMNLKKYTNDWLQLKFDRNSRIVLLLLYAIIMLTTISNQINVISFVILFLVLPVSIYYLVKYVFPNNMNKKD
jgi:hypothetical protein